MHQTQADALRPLTTKRFPRAARFPLIARSVARVLLASAILAGAAFLPAASAAAPPRQGSDATAELLGPGFNKYQSDHYVVYSDADRTWTRQRIRLLEATEREVRRAMNRLGVAFTPPESPLVVILFADRDDYRAFARAHDNVQADWIAGYYATAPNHVVFYDDRTRPDLAAAAEQIEQWEREARELRREAIRVRARESADAADRMNARANAIETHATTERRRIEELTEEAANAKTIHEAAHQLAFNTGLQSRAHAYPFWLTEGWATNFEAVDHRRAFGPDYAVVPRQAAWAETVAAGRQQPIADFIAIKELRTTDPQVATDRYAQAYALFAHLYRHDRAQLGRYFRAIAEEPPGDIPAPRLVELFHEHFGDPRRIERNMMR